MEKGLRRRQFLGAVAAGGAAGWLLQVKAGSSSLEEAVEKLVPPESGRLRVAFLISSGSNVIDMAGPWEVFQDVELPAGHPNTSSPFELFTVAEKAEPVRATGGLHLIPDHSVETAPVPRVVVVPAMRGAPSIHEWLRKMADQADMVMSVCTGAFQLARAGLLDGKEATTHHLFQDELQRAFPEVKVKKGLRFVEGGPKISTAGGLTSGFDMALRVVERYFGRDAARRTARYMEYESELWTS